MAVEHALIVSVRESIKRFQDPAAACRAPGTRELASEKFNHRVNFANLHAKRQ